VAVKVGTLFGLIGSVTGKLDIYYAVDMCGRTGLYCRTAAGRDIVALFTGDTAFSEVCGMRAGKCRSSGGISMATGAGQGSSPRRCGINSGCSALTIAVTVKIRTLVALTAGVESATDKFNVNIASSSAGGVGKRLDFRSMIVVTLRAGVGAGAEVGSMLCTVDRMVACSGGGIMALGATACCGEFRTAPRRSRAQLTFAVTVAVYV